MGQHADDAIEDAINEEEYRARELPDDESVHSSFEYNIPTLENVDNELTRLMDCFKRNL